jgi:hypothetical protein
MANINELEWVTPEGENYPVATTTIGGEEVSITKLDEDSFKVNTSIETRELNLEQLNVFLEQEVFSNAEHVETINVLHENALAKLEIWRSPKIWKSIKNVGKQVLEFPHSVYPDATVRIIKIDENSYKVAVIGIPPNDGEEIQYLDVDEKVALMNYSYAAGYGIIAGEDYYDNMYNEPAVSESEQTDFEIVQTDSIEQTGFDVIPDEVPCVGCH